MEKNEKERELRCGKCEARIEYCAGCGKEFTIGDIIYCFHDGFKHYCGDCIKEAGAERGYIVELANTLIKRD